MGSINPPSNANCSGDEIRDCLCRMIREIDETGAPLPTLCAIMHSLNNVRKRTTLAQFKPLLRVHKYAGADRRQLARP
jgi:hypothetical protein